MKSIVFLALLGGCAYSVDPRTDDSMSEECAIPPFRYVRGNQLLSCRNFSLNTATARNMMIARGWVRDEADFNSQYKDLGIQIVDQKCLQGLSVLGLVPLPGCVYGEFEPNSVRPGAAQPQYLISLDHDATALGHELMHYYDVLHGRGDVTAMHDHWQELGYYRFQDDYSHAALPVME